MATLPFRTVGLHVAGGTGDVVIAGARRLEERDDVVTDGDAITVRQTPSISPLGRAPGPSATLFAL